MPKDDDRLWQWGKHKGTPLQDLSTNYLQWAVQNFTFDKAVTVAVKELKYRDADVPIERNVETPEQKTIGRLQYELKKATAQLTNLTEGLNRLLVASNLQSVTLEPVVKSDYDKPKPERGSKSKSSSNVDTPWGNDDVSDDPFDEFEPAF